MINPAENPVEDTSILPQNYEKEILPLLNPDRPEYFKFNNDNLSFQTRDLLVRKGFVPEDFNEISLCITNDSGSLNTELTWHRNEDGEWVDKNGQPVKLTEAEIAQLEGRMPNAPESVLVNAVSRYLRLRYAITKNSGALPSEFESLLPFMVEAAFLRETTGAAGYFYHLSPEEWRESAHRTDAIDMGFRLARDFAEHVPNFPGRISDESEDVFQESGKLSGSESIFRKIRRLFRT